MPYSIPGNVAETAIAKQSAEGSAASGATYSQQVFSGRALPAVTYNTIDVTDTTSALPMVWKGVQDGSLDIVIPPFPASTGTYLRGILNTDTKSGSADPYTHAFTFGTVADAWNTVFQTSPGSLFETYADTVISSLTFEFGADKLLRLHVVGTSKTSTRQTSVYTVTTPELVNPTSEFFHTNGAVFKLTVNGTPATDTIDNVESGSITISKPVTPVPTADTIATAYFNKERLTVSADLTLVMKDLTQYNNAFYGGPSGTSPSASIPSASIDFTFPCFNSATHTLQIQMPWLDMKVDPPQPDPAGSEQRIHVVCDGVRPTSGALVTATLKNAVSTTY